MKETIGKCGNCGGSVKREAGPLWISGEWPRPQCEQCGAVPYDFDKDRVLPMNPAPQPMQPRRTPFAHETTDDLRFTNS
jgi:hypothetical protein